MNIILYTCTNTNYQYRTAFCSVQVQGDIRSFPLEYLGDGSVHLPVCNISYRVHEQPQCENFMQKSQTTGEHVLLHVWNIYEFVHI